MIFTLINTVTHNPDDERVFAHKSKAKLYLNIF